MLRDIIDRLSKLDYDSPDSMAAKINGRVLILETENERKVKGEKRLEPKFQR